MSYVAYSYSESYDDKLFRIQIKAIISVIGAITFAYHFKSVTDRNPSHKVIVSVIDLEYCPGRFVQMAGPENVVSAPRKPIIEAILFHHFLTLGLILLKGGCRWIISGDPVLWKSKGTGYISFIIHYEYSRISRECDNNTFLIRTEVVF